MPQCRPFGFSTCRVYKFFCFIPNFLPEPPFRVFLSPGCPFLPKSPFWVFNLSGRFMRSILIALNCTMFLTQISHVFLSFYYHFLVLCSFFLCFQDSCHFRAFCEETSQNAKKLGFFKIFCTYGVQHRAGYRKRDDVAHFHPEINCHVPMISPIISMPHIAKGHGAVKTFRRTGGMCTLSA